MFKWYYHGPFYCDIALTHSEGMKQLVKRYGSKDLSRFEGMLANQTDTSPYIATVSRLPGWGFTALAFWAPIEVNRRSDRIFFCSDLQINMTPCWRGPWRGFRRSSRLCHCR